MTTFEMPSWEIRTDYFRDDKIVRSVAVYYDTGKLVFGRVLSVKECEELDVQSV